jgi:hypothetical protein
MDGLAHSVVSSGEAVPHALPAVIEPGGGFEQSAEAGELSADLEENLYQAWLPAGLNKHRLEVGVEPLEEGAALFEGARGRSEHQVAHLSQMGEEPFMPIPWRR